MSLAVYVASPYEDAAFVRECVHPRLVEDGMLPTSRWADHARGPEDFARMTPAAMRASRRANDADIMASDVLLVLARPAAGGEMFREIGFALNLGKAVVWSGRLILSAFEDGVVRVEDLDAALAVLATMRTRHAEGHRGAMLAHLAGAA